MITISPSVKSFFPQARFGAMIVSGVGQPADRSIMDALIADEIKQLKASYPDYERKNALASEPLCHYAAYYKHFKKSYHVLGQLESTLLKGKSIPPVGVPVEAMFLAEMKSQLLSAGHDLDMIQGRLTVDVAAEPLAYRSISGKDQQLAVNDLFLSDEAGVLSSIIGGPDYRTRITDTTRNCLYFVYGVEGVTSQRIETHLETLASYLSKAINEVQIKSIDIY